MGVNHYPLELREQVLTEYEFGLGGYRTLAKKHGLKRDTVSIVVFETGFFMGRVGRKNHLIIIADHGVELPSDMHGILYTDSKSLEVDVLKGLRAMGYAIDMNKL